MTYYTDYTDCKTYRELGLTKKREKEIQKFFKLSWDTYDTPWIFLKQVSVDRSWPPTETIYYGFLVGIAYEKQCEKIRNQKN